MTLISVVISFLKNNFSFFNLFSYSMMWAWGKMMIRYDIAQNVAIRYDKIPKRTAVFSNCMLLRTPYTQVGLWLTV